MYYHYLFSTRWKKQLMCYKMILYENKINRQGEIQIISISQVPTSSNLFSDKGPRPQFIEALHMAWISGIITASSNMAHALLQS